MLEYKVGQKASEKFKITNEIYEFFLNQIGDNSAIHQNVQFARNQGFKDVIMHNCALNAFLARFTGSRLPGPRSMTLATELRYSNPCYLEDEIEITAEVAQIVESERVVVLLLKFNNLTQGNAAAVGRVTSKVLA